MMEDCDDDDILGNPAFAHPRARELMPEEFFWDCTDEEAPFGSDEGDTALHEYREWRRCHPDGALVQCLSWIMNGKLDQYTDHLLVDERMARDLSDPDGALLARHHDMFTLDTTVLATGLAQLLYEGHIDSEAKPYIRVAIKRQLHPRVVKGDHRAAILQAALRVVEAA